MPKVVTVCISLEPEYVEALDKVARKAGSRSAAVRQLIARNATTDCLEKMETAYREYYADPEAAKSREELTRDMLVASSWLGSRPGGIRKRKGGGKKGTPR
jgi:metal-responsive CopG/Arc/MetJ family transcriptional regulator